MPRSCTARNLVLASAVRLCPARPADCGSMVTRPTRRRFPWPLAGKTAGMAEPFADQDLQPCASSIVPPTTCRVGPPMLGFTRPGVRPSGDAGYDRVNTGTETRRAYRT